MPIRPASFAPLALALLALLVPAGNAHALHIREAATTHQRFTGFPAQPIANPDFLFAGMDFSGVGWQQNATSRQLTLISRRHGLLATHNLPPIGASFLFLSQSGQLVSRSVTALTTVTDAGQPSDLTLVTLDAPIEASEGIEPLPYFDLPAETDYRRTNLIIFGTAARAGINQLAAVRNLSQGGLHPSRVLTFEYNYGSGDPDEAHLQSGDSGSPSFAIVNGAPALVGTHTATSEFFGVQRVNYDTFVPRYAPSINALIAVDGYRMRPVNADTTDLIGDLDPQTSEPKQAMPLSIDLVIENTGDEPAGNLEIELDFPIGQEPSSLSADGWVSCQDGQCWTLRRATLDATAKGTVTAHWDEAPALAALTPTVTVCSDNADAASLAATIILAPSFAQWTSALTANGEDDDPDHDGIANLLEYAFGGDPHGPGHLRFDPSSLIPTLRHSGNSFVYSFHERADKVSRGLHYLVEFSTTLAAGSWSTTPPPGVTVIEGLGASGPDGFVRRNLSWSSDHESLFTRLRVTLDE